MDLQTISIKGKKYVTVNERLKYFREKFPSYSLITELVEVNDKSALIRATIINDKGVMVATGTSFERADNKHSMVNATSHVENCETSAWGRALGNFGIGIDTSVASADEVTRAADKPQYEHPKKTREESDKMHTGGAIKITKLCTETKTDPAKLYEFFNVQGVPTKEQAKAMIASLEKKLGKQLDETPASEALPDLQ